jgi:hypothetical protein
LEVVRTSDANGWVVLPDGFGIWVAGPGTLTRIDPRTGATRVTAHGSWDYDYVRLAEYGEGTIFVASGETLLEMDAGSGTVIARMDLSSVGYIDAVLASIHGIWVTASGDDGSQVLAEIDPDTGHVLRRVHRIGQGVHRLAEAHGYLFVGSVDRPSLIRFDPRTGAVTPIRSAPVGPSVAGTGSHLWFTRRDGVQCLDAVTLTSCGNVDLPGFIRLAASGRDLWVLSEPHPASDTSSANRRTTVTLIDGRSGEVVAGPLPIDGRPASIAAFQGRAWVGYYRTGNVTEIARCRPGTCSGRSAS